MSAGHLLPHQSHWNRAVSIDMNRRHRKWPLGMPVQTKTPAGYLQGQIFKHWRRGEVPHGASVRFPEPVDMGDGNGLRDCHVIPFRSLKPLRPACGHD